MSLVLLGILNSQAAAAGGYVDEPGFDLLAQTSPGGNSVTFTGLNTLGYTHYQVWWTARGQTVNFSSAMTIRINGNSGATYYSGNLRTQGSGIATSGLNSTGGFNIQDAITLSSNSAERRSAGILDIIDSQNSNKNAVMRMAYGQRGLDTRFDLEGGYVAISNPITSISFIEANGGNYTSAASRFSLYGIRGE